MSLISKISILPAIAVLTAAASAQIVPTGPFTGQQSDSFQTQVAGQFTTCIVGRVFNNTADLCDPMWNSIHITGGWSFFCQIPPHAGSLFAGSAGGPAEYTFDQPASRFGGFWGTNSGTAGAIVEFYDVAN